MMNKIIKFRSWDKKNKIMSDVVMMDWWIGQIGSKDFGTIRSVRTFNDEMEEPNFELMQFTGLKDKNGKEIYEGDICQMYWQGHKIIGTMMFNQEKAQFGLDANVDFESPEHIADVPDRPEIIGNIYESKHLHD